MVDKNKHMFTRERSFIDELLMDPKRNARQAALRAGYSPNNIDSRVVELMKRPRVINALKAQALKNQVRVGRTLADVVAELEKIAFANTMDFIKLTQEGELVTDFSQMTREQAAAISEVTVDSVKGEDGEVVKRTRFKLHDKKGALVDLGKHLGGFVTRSKNENNNTFVSPDGEPVEVRHKIEFVDPPAKGKK